MRLSDHPDFRQAIVQAAEHFAEGGLRPVLIEKDYYVTETLRIIATTIGDKIIFKGGTSLSKGWNLIQRFSEDVDIFLDPRAFAPVLGKNGINRELKALRDAVATHPGLTFVPAESRTIGALIRLLGYQAATHQQAGRIRAAGMTKDVVFEPVTGLSTIGSTRPTERTPGART
jgi:hypothetical protein